MLCLLIVASGSAFTAAVLLEKPQQQLPVIQELEAETVFPLDPISVFPHFDSFTEIEIKKRFFFDFIEIYVEAENQKIVQKREQLTELVKVAEDKSTLSGIEMRRLMALADEFRVDTIENGDHQIIVELLKRVDTIPDSLVLAQAAVESAWGSSRFALEGNNIFGQYCYDPGCGLVPSSRASSDTHEVRSFANIEESVMAYFININTHASYEYFRELRAQMRKENADLEPMELVHGLGTYSVRGQLYIDDIRIIMQQNELVSRDRF